MVSFQRMKDELDDLGTHVSNKLPVLGRSGCLIVVAVVATLIFVVAFVIGYSIKGDDTVTASEPTAAKSVDQVHNQDYFFGHDTDDHLDHFHAVDNDLAHGDDDHAFAMPTYVFVSNNSYSCPELKAERLLTTMEAGQSFEGLVVNLACRGDFNAFPNQVGPRLEINCPFPINILPTTMTS